MTGAEWALDARKHQIDDLDYTTQHDMASCSKAELPIAATAYAMAAATRVLQPHVTLAAIKELMMGMFPWDEKFCKPTEDPRSMLAKAAALCMAEIDRLNAIEEANNAEGNTAPVE